MHFVNSKILYLAIWLLVPGFVTYGQQSISDPLMPNVIPPSPTAASLGKYGDIPVGYYAGVPNISVPLLQVSGRSLSVPIGLNYHSSGIKVDEVASWVGLGWSADVGGVITRSVNGFEDERSGAGFWDIESSLADAFGNPTDEAQFHIAEGLWDSQPDMFYYNFGGTSGKFIVAGDGGIHCIPHNNLKIYRDPSMGFFEITTPDGTVYHFADFEDTSSQSPESASVFKSSWYLTRIVSADRRDSIRFTYASSTITQPVRRSETEYRQNVGNGSDCSFKPKSFSINTTTIGTKYVQSIVSATDSVRFFSQANRSDLTGAHKLDSIAVWKNGVRVKGFHLFYSYFQATGTANRAAPFSGTTYGDFSKRLRLDSLTESSATGEQLPPYVFTYNESQSIPSVGSFAVDHWGYFNGQNYNTSLLPEVELGNNEVWPGANREPDADYAVAGVLEKITYPTGGSAAFEYEGHQQQTALRYQTVGSSKSVSVDYPTSGSIVTDEIPFTLTHDQDIQLVYRIENQSLNANEIGEGSLVIEEVNVSASNNDNCSNSNHPNAIECFYPTATGPGVFTAIQKITLKAGTYRFKATVGIAGDHVDATVTYQVEQYQLPMVGFKPIGGIRLKKQVVHDGMDPSKDMIREYRYTDPSDDRISTGLAQGIPRYSYISHEVIVENSNANIPLIKRICDYYTRTTSSNGPLTYNQGSPVAYAAVTELLGAAGSNGKTIYHYTTNLDAIVNTFPFPPATSYEYKRGLLVKTETFNVDDQLVQKQATDYAYSGPLKAVRGFVVQYDVNTPFVYPTHGDLYSIALYDVTSEWVYQTATTTTLYDPVTGDSILERTDYEYANDQHLMPTSTIETLSDGQIRVNKTKYPQDYVSTAIVGGANSNVTIDHLLQKYMINTPIEYQTWQGPDMNNLSLISGKVTAYADINSTANPSTSQLDDMMIVPTEVYVLEIGSPLSEANFGENTLGTLAKYTEVIPNTSVYQNRVSITYNPVTGNITEQAYTDGQPTAFLWGHDGYRPIAQAQNAHASEIAFAGFEAGTSNEGNWTFSAASTSNDAKSGNYAQDLSQGSIFKTDIPSGKKYKVSFWGKNLSAAVVLNGTPKGNTAANSTWQYYEYELDLSAASTAGTVNLSGTGLIDDLRLHPVDAQMSTFSFDEALRLCGVSDVNNRPMHYDYDDFGRFALAMDHQGNFIQQILYSIAR